MSYKKPCFYCNKEVILVKGNVVYPQLDGLHHKNFWACSDPTCNAYVGCHSGTTKSMGIVARKELRKLRNTCHINFDGLWRSLNVKRSIAYNWIAWFCGTQPDCPEWLKERTTLHFGYMREPECNYILELLNRKDIPESLLSYNKV